jgi:hypothetical protein
MPPNENGWKDYEIKRLGDAVMRIEHKLGRIETHIALLKLKSGMWGAIAGALAAIGPVIYLIWKES